MGVSTDAILTFGIMIDEGTDISHLSDDGYEMNNETEDACMTIHCALEYPMYIISVPETKTVAWRGYPKGIDVDSFKVPQEKIDKLIAWCEKHGITGTPQWYLCSLWG